MACKSRSDQLLFDLWMIFDHGRKFAVKLNVMKMTQESKASHCYISRKICLEIIECHENVTSKASHCYISRLPGKNKPHTIGIHKIEGRVTTLNID